MNSRYVQGLVEYKKNLKKHRSYIIVAIVILGSLITHFSMQIVLGTRQPISIVMSGSMEPVYHKGDVIFASGVDAEDLKLGDIIIFDPSSLWDDAPQGLLAHRVINKIQIEGIWYVQTKGDANTWAEQGLIPEDRILGKVWGFIPGIGWIIAFLIETNLHVSLSTIAIFAYLFLIFSKKFIKFLR
jgi:signal peptidase